MKFFLDSANLSEIKEASELGLLDGVTTNPSLVAKENKQNDFKTTIKEICKIAGGPVSAEVISTDFKSMKKEALELSKIDKNVVIKLPMTIDGIKTTKFLSKKKIAVNVTLIFSAPQALIAAKAGAAYVSPFVGRLDDISSNGMNLITEISD
ncbi:fructose-6-phosphate aldolase, partial [bacterium]|nr:fructose-6-phosphate aldolase [bacterium]